MQHQKWMNAPHLPGCEYCRREPEPGWIEQDNNGPIVPCFCNPLSTKEGQIEAAYQQRNRQSN